MKKIFVIISTVILVILLIHISLYVFINIKGKDLLKDAIQKNFNAQAQVKSLSLKFPFSLEIKQFSCGDVAFKKANLSISLTKLFNFPLMLNNISIEGLKAKIIKDKDSISIKPFFEKTSKDETIEVPTTGTQVKPEVKDTVEGKKKDFSFTIKKVNCKNARLEVVYSSNKKPVTIIFDDVSLSIDNFKYPQFSKFYLKLESSLSSPSTQRSMPKVLNLNGWLDWPHKNMDMSLNISHFDYMAFSEYYPEVWKPKNLGIKEASLSLDTKLISKNNDLTVDWLLLLEEIAFLKASGDGSRSRVKILKTIIEGFKINTDKPQFHFIYKAKMDAPWQFFPSLLKSLRSAVPLGPTIIAEKLIQKAKDNIPKGAAKAIDKTKDTISKGVEGVKKITVDTAIDAIDSAIGAVKDIMSSSEEIDN